MNVGTFVIRAAVGTTVIALTAAPAAAGPSDQPVVVHVGRIDKQDIASASHCEPDTLAEPDVAVSPTDPNIAVAVAHDCRLPTAGAVGISYAWTHDGGQNWQHAPLPGITQAAGGVWARASDPVVAFGPDGSVYISVLDISSGCRTAVSVSRSTDGGVTFGAPVLAQRNKTCRHGDDKNFLIVDNGRHSPYRGRLYQFWAQFSGVSIGFGDRQVVRWSDDQGQTWSHTVALTPRGIVTINSQPVVKPDGSIVDTYLNFGTSGGEEGRASRVGADTSMLAAGPPALRIGARVSHDGGLTWSAESTVTRRAGVGPAGIRCCLPSATADPRTGRLYATWIRPDAGAVMLSTSTGGRRWSTPLRVTSSSPGYDYVNVDVAAYGGEVLVSTGLHRGRFVQQEVLSSAGRSSFSAPVALGPRSNLKYAAEAGGKFPGDYIGTAATHGRSYAVWCRSSKPSDPNAKYHQVLWGATLRI
ncbi:MAG TPA: sialidase family protein [Jatrophihabitans sp.]|nr:sialidase family protein [Jatrophihabitans sp.]